MKRLWLFLLLAVLLVPVFANMIPRVYVQKVLLEDGTNPPITVIQDTSAPEYNIRAWIKERPEEMMDTDSLRANHLSITQVGDAEKFPITVVVKLNLGNFKSDWVAGETLHFVLTHKESKQVKEWDVVIPEGTALIKMLDEPLIIPPYTVEKVKEHGKDCGTCPNNNH